MTENPYEAPDSKLGVPESPVQRPIRGIFLGLVADVGGTLVCSFLLAFVYATTLASQGMNTEDIQQTLTNVDGFYGVVSTMLGLAMSYLGGFVCIRVSHGVDLKNPIVLGVITIVFAVLMAWGAYGLYEFAALVFISFLATLWGGRMAIHKRTKEAVIEA